MNNNKTIIEPTNKHYTININTNYQVKMITLIFSIYNESKGETTTMTNNVSTA